MKPPEAPTDFALFARLAELARRAPERPALRQGAGVRTFAQLVEGALGLARQAAHAGVAPDQVVAVTADGSPRAVETTLALRLAGAVPVLLGAGTKAPALAAWLCAAKADGTGFTALGRGGAPPAGTRWLRQTGGTTSAPRLVAFNDEQIAAAASIAHEFLALAEGDEVVATVPAAHGYGWNTAGFAPLLAGATTTFVSPLDPHAFAEHLARPGVRWGVTTAPVIRALSRLATDATAPRALAPALVAAAAYPAGEAEIVHRKLGLRVLDRYGATEAGPVAQAREPGGPLVPSRAFRLREAGETAGAASGPTLHIAGPSVAMGYVEDEAPFALRPFAGVFATADRVAFEAGGAFRVLGRADRVIRRAGRALDLVRIERLLCRVPGVARARVRAVAVPGAMDVDLIADVVPDALSTASADDLLAALAPALEPWERPKRIDLRADAPADGAEKWTAREDG